MRFASPLRRATLIRRYKRFLSDHRLDDGSVVTAHCANPGQMTGIAEAGMTTWLQDVSGGKRKLAWSWELVCADGGLVGCHTGKPNSLVEEAITQERIAELAGYASLRREVVWGSHSRFDFLLEDPARGCCYVEVKNCHMRRSGAWAEFPDAVTTRGARHMEELVSVVAAGHRAVVMWCVQRMDCDSLAIAGDIDPGFAAAVARASLRGVETLAYSCRLTTQDILIDQRIPVRLA